MPRIAKLFGKTRTTKIFHDLILQYIHPSRNNDDQIYEHIFHIYHSVLYDMVDALYNDHKIWAQASKSCFLFSLVCVEFFLRRVVLQDHHLGLIGCFHSSSMLFVKGTLRHHFVQSWKLANLKNTQLGEINILVNSIWSPSASEGRSTNPGLAPVFK